MATLEALIAAGADINVPNDNNATPLYAAAAGQSGVLARASVCGVLKVQRVLGLAPRHELFSFSRPLVRW